MPHYVYSSVSRIGGGVFLFDSSAGESELLLPGRFRGLTRARDGWIYAVTGARRHHAAPPTHIHRVCPITRTHEDLGPVPWKACHDLKWLRDSFYLVASISNTIARLDCDLREIDRFQLVPDERDVCHVNCLGDCDGELYCSVFTLSPGTRAEKRLTAAWTTEGKVLRLDFDRKRFEVAYETLAQPHSLNFREGVLYLTESHSSRITTLNLQDGSSRVVAQLSGFVRGLSFGPGEVLAATSRMFAYERRQSRHVPWLTRLRDRLRPFSGFYHLDRNWNIHRRSALGESEVYDVLALERASPSAENCR